MSFNKLLFGIIITGMLLATSACTGISTNDDSTTRTSEYRHRGYWITVDDLPIGTHYTGDSFAVSGETDLPVGEDLEYAAYIAMFIPGSPNLLPPSCSGSTLIMAGKGVNHTWSFVLDTTQCHKQLINGTIIRQDAFAGDYILDIGLPGDDMYSYRYPFTLVNRPPETNESPTWTVISPLSSKVPQQSATVPAALPLILPVIALGIGIVFGALRRRFK